MGQARPRDRVVLDSSDRARLVQLLDEIAGRTIALEETLAVAAVRSGTSLSAWTEARLDALRDAVAELRGQVLHAPLDGD